MKVTNIEQAWAEVNKIFPTDYEKRQASAPAMTFTDTRRLIIITAFVTWVTVLKFLLVSTARM